MSEKKIELSNLAQTNKTGQQKDNEINHELKIIISGELPVERTILILGGKK